MLHYTTDIAEFCEKDSNLSKELLKEREKYLSSTPEKYYKTPDKKIGLKKDFMIISYFPISPNIMK